MKKTIINQLVALAFGLGMATTASAAFIGLTGTGTVSHTPGYAPGPGLPEYTWTITSDPALPDVSKSYTPATSLAKNSFQTFCLEQDEDSGDGRFILNSAADGGGSNTNAGDPLSAGVAWLYSQFASGVLAGYNYAPGAGRLASASLLQRAIWGLEDEYYMEAGDNPFYDLALAHGGEADAAPGQYGVYVMNITGARGEKLQDFLIHVPEGGSTLIVLGLSLCGLSIFRSRLQNKA